MWRCLDYHQAQNNLADGTPLKAFEDGIRGKSKANLPSKMRQDGNYQR